MKDCLHILIPQSVECYSFLDLEVFQQLHSEVRNNYVSKFEVHLPVLCWFVDIIHTVRLQNIRRKGRYIELDLINEFIIESSSSVFMNSDTVNKAFNLDWVVFHTLVSGLLSIQIKLLPFVPRKQFLYQTVFKNFIITGKVVKQFSFPRVIKNDSFLKFDSKIYIYIKKLPRAKVFSCIVYYSIKILIAWMLNIVVRVITKYGIINKQTLIK